IFGIHGQRRATGREVAAFEDQAPAFATVGGAVDAAIGAVAPQLAGHARVDQVAVFGMHEDARDALRLAEAEVGPVFPTVGRFVDAVADGDRVAGPGLASADPDRLRIGRIESDGANR